MSVFRWLVLLLITVCAPALSAMDIGHITEVGRDVDLIRDGSVFAIEPGVAVLVDDIIKTGEDSAVQLEMRDGSVLDIGPLSELHLASYELQEDGQLQAGEVSLLTGWLRFITSKLSYNRSFEIYTPNMAIGIRGTEGIIGIEEESSELELTSGEVGVTGIDTLGNDFQGSQAIASGQYIKHRLNGSVEYLATAPESFKVRKHPRFQRAVQRRLKKLAKRDVLPRRLRQANVQDLKGLLKSNPRIRQRLFKHLQKRMKDPVFRKKMKTYLEKNPRLGKRLRSSKAFRQEAKKYSKQKRGKWLKNRQLEKK